MMHDYESDNEQIEWSILRNNDECAVGGQPILSQFFEEAPLDHLPTYRLERNSARYSEERVASWTDRIFMHVNNKKFGMEILEFDGLLS